jgi:hypothetical protein
MHADFATDWDKLGRLAFRRQEKTGTLFKRVHGVLKKYTTHPDITRLDIIRQWLLVPFTLWPIDFVGLGTHVCERIKSGRRLQPAIAFLLNELEKLPGTATQTAIAEYERRVERGTYEPFLRVPEKYASQERELLTDPALKQEWSTLKKMFPVDQYKNRNGVVRRSMVQERNFRPAWESTPQTQRERFQMAFDAFCFRWNLYGMESDKPLLLKLSVNPTAHGLMIVIPRYWSFDPKRDLDWRQINELHRIRGALRQGPKMSGGRVERHEQARRAVAASHEARELKLRGAERFKFIACKIGLRPGTEPRTIRRLITEGKALTR